MADADNYRSGVLDGAIMVIEQLNRSAAACLEESKAAKAAGDLDRANQLLGGADAMTAFSAGFSQHLRKLQEQATAGHRETMRKECRGGAVEVALIANGDLPRAGGKRG